MKIIQDIRIDLLVCKILDKISQRDLEITKNTVRYTTIS